MKKKMAMKVSPVVIHSFPKQVPFELIPQPSPKMTIKVIFNDPNDRFSEMEAEETVLKNEILLKN